MSSSSLSQRMLVEKLIENASVDDQLFKLEHIFPARTWDYSLPTLVKDGRFTARLPWTSSESFTTDLMKRFPIFKELDMSHIAIVGGFTLDILLGKSPNDIDLFVVTEQSLSPKEALDFAHQRIKTFITAMYSFMDEHNKRLEEMQRETRLKKPSFYISSDQFYRLDDFSVQRFKNVFTLKIPSVSIPIQIICTPYETINKLLQVIDIGCTSLAYYQGQVLFSEIGKFCFENLAFIVKGTRKSEKCIRRICKYFEKGFDVILPHLNIAKVRHYNLKFNASEVVDLPFLTVIISGLKGNKIEVSRLAVPPLQDTEHGDAQDDFVSGYDQSEMMQDGAAIHHNIRCLIHDNLEDFIYKGSGASLELAFLSRPLITERMIVNTYETLKTSIYANGSLKLTLLEKFFSCKKTSKILAQLFLDYIIKRETEMEASKKPAPIFNAFFSKQMEQEISALIDEQIACTKAKLVALQSITPALSLPIGTIEHQKVACDPVEWLGEYFIDLNVA